MKPINSFDVETYKIIEPIMSEINNIIDEAKEKEREGHIYEAINLYLHAKTKCIYVERGKKIIFADGCIDENLMMSLDKKIQELQSKI